MIYINYNTLNEVLIQEILNWNEQTKRNDVWASNQVKWVESLKIATSGTILSRVFPEDIKNYVFVHDPIYHKMVYMPEI